VEKEIIVERPVVQTVVVEREVVIKKLVIPTAIPVPPTSTPSAQFPPLDRVTLIKDGDVLQLSGLEFPQEETQEGPYGGTAIMIPAPGWESDSPKPCPTTEKVAAGKVIFWVCWVQEGEGFRQYVWIQAEKQYALRVEAPYLNLSAEIDGRHKMEVWQYGEDIEHNLPSYIAVVFPEISYE